MGRKYPARTCTFSEKVLRINGPSHYLLDISQTLAILGRSSKIFFDFVI
jgi:hypothetical protein